MPNHLEHIGWNASVAASVPPGSLERFSVARVVAVHRERYTISNGVRESAAEPVGRLLYSASSPIDYPAVGDWVLVTLYDEDAFALIHDVVPRSSMLQRKTAGKKVEVQVIAANIDVAFIVQSLNENFNLRRLERYLVVVNESKIQPVVLLSKCDLLSPEEVASRVGEIEQVVPGRQVIPFSNANASGLDALRSAMLPGLTYCLLGSSGVGKTTLINNLVGRPEFRTGSVSRKESKGRHVTTHRQLTLLDNGAMVVDTPGMRELGVFSVDAGIEETFADILVLAEACRFSDCTHVNEQRCAVLEAVDRGVLSAERYRNYLKMSRESAYNARSYLEKREKDRQFGRHCRAVLKQKARQR